MVGPGAQLLLDIQVQLLAAHFQHLLLAGKMVVKRAGGHPGFPADIPDGYFLIPVLQHQAAACLDEPLLRGLALGPAALLIIHGSPPPRPAVAVDICPWPLYNRNIT